MVIFFVILGVIFGLALISFLLALPFIVLGMSIGGIVGASRGGN